VEGKRRGREGGLARTLFSSRDGTGKAASNARHEIESTCWSTGLGKINGRAACRLWRLGLREKGGEAILFLAGTEGRAQRKPDNASHLEAQETLSRTGGGKKRPGSMRFPTRSKSEKWHPKNRACSCQENEALRLDVWGGERGVLHTPSQKAKESGRRGRTLRVQKKKKKGEISG